MKRGGDLLRRLLVSFAVVVAVFGFLSTTTTAGASDARALLAGLHGYDTPLKNPSMLSLVEGASAHDATLLAARQSSVPSLARSVVAAEAELSVVGPATGVGPGAAHISELGGLGEGPEAEAVNVTNLQRIGYGQDVLHHVFPQQFEAEFAARGININDYTVALDEATHQAIHTLGYNEAIWGAITNQEAFLGRMLTPEDVLATGQTMVEQYGISGPFVPYGG